LDNVPFNSRAQRPAFAQHPVRVPAAGGTRLAHETVKTQSHEKSQFDGVNPAVRVHAVLGGSDLNQRLDH
jgi:hypothetical protein